MWLYGQICGDAKAKAVQLVIEYDPQPPYDSGHMSKASAATKAAATAALSVETSSLRSSPSPHEGSHRRERRWAAVTRSSEAWRR